MPRMAVVVSGGTSRGYSLVEKRARMVCSGSPPGGRVDGMGGNSENSRKCMISEELRTVMNVFGVVSSVNRGASWAVFLGLS